MKSRVADGESEPPAAEPHSPGRRLFWLLACVALGLGVGLGGFQFTGNPAWFLAVPAVLAVGWFVFANPAQCLPSPRRGPGDDPAR